MLELRALNLFVVLLLKILVLSASTRRFVVISFFSDHILVSYIISTMNFCFCVVCRGGETPERRQPLLSTVSLISTRARNSAREKDRDRERAIPRAVIFDNDHIIL